MQDEMRVLLVKWVAQCLAWMPLPLNHAIGAAIGWVLWVSNNKLRTITEFNLELCFPRWSARERHRVARTSLIETGKALTESFWIWQRSPQTLERLIRQTHGQELLENSWVSNKGLMAATPHMGAWELCNLPLSREEPVRYLYRTPRLAELEPLLIQWRANLNAKPARLDQAGIRSLLETLRSGGTIGVLPDQEPDEKSGTFAPLFGVPANTMTLLAKLAKRGNADVLFCYAERLPRGKGWTIHYLKPDPDITSTDRLVAARALNRTVERCILQCPTQYIWNYKRFRRLPDGLRRHYKKT